MKHDNPQFPEKPPQLAGEQTHNSGVSVNSADETGTRSGSPIDRSSDRKTYMQQAIKVAEQLQRLAGSLIVSLKLLCYVNAIAGLWLWLLFFHTFLFSLSWWTLSFLPVFIALMLPSAILYRAIVKLGEIVELPTRVREHFKRTTPAKSQVGSNFVMNGNVGVSQRTKRSKPITALKQFYRQYDFFSGLFDTSMFAVTLINPYQKALLLIMAIIAIAQIALGGITFTAYFIFFILF